jgi:putative tryptophan/tyrosine transport system substrate-binding protein
MMRREFVRLVAGATVGWPLMVLAQRPPMAVIGFLGAPAAQPYERYTAAIRQGLNETGYIEGQNLTIEYRWAEGHYDRLPALATELINRHVSAIVTIGGAPATVAARAATLTIPIVFNITADPIKLGLVASLNRPGGNTTGIAMLGVELEAKRLELLHEVAPTAALIGVLLNPTNPQFNIQLEDVQTAARAINQRILVVKASSELELDAAFKTLAQESVGALLVGQDTFFTSQPTLFAMLTARHAIPTVSAWRAHVEVGGLMSYGASLLDAYRQAGVYAGRVLRGERPAELPVVQAVKFELVINLKTAKALGLSVPATLIARADEVIE